MRLACLLALFLSMLAACSAEPGTSPSRFGKLTSRRWSYGQAWQRANLAPVANPNPAPEAQPPRLHPYDAAVSADGTRVYVGLQGSELRPGHEIAVYDVAADRVVKRIALKPAKAAGEAASSPYRLTMHPSGHWLLVTSRFSNFASVVDTRTDTVSSEVALDFYCQGAAFDASGRRLYAANRYLDQVFAADVKADETSFQASMREMGGLDDAAFFGDVHPVLRRTCGTSGCHDQTRGAFYAGPDAKESFVSVLSHVRPGNASASRLLRAVVRTRDGGYADRLPVSLGHSKGTVVFPDPAGDPDYQAVAKWIDAGAEGPGIGVGNPGSKPKVMALSSDGRWLFVGNTGTQDISIVDTATSREVGGIYVQNVVNDLRIYRSPAGRDYLLATTEGIGFGVARERDPYGGESWDAANPAAQYSAWRDIATGLMLGREQQAVLGPFDAVDGTSAIKFRDIQNDIVMVDVGGLDIPQPGAGPLRHVLLANRYEAHREWVRYTSDTAESTFGDVKGDIPPELMRVAGALPEKMALVGDRLYVTMQGTNEVQAWRIDTDAPDPSDFLVPTGVYRTGMQPIGIAAGPGGTPAAGKLFVANFLGGTLTVIDVDGASREVLLDESVARIPVGSTNAERGEVMAHTALLSSDGDTSCFHCHYLDMGDGRPWGVSQVVGQEYVHGQGELIIGGTMTVPQMRNLFAIQPFFLEGTLSAFEPRSMLMEHAPAEDFTMATPQGDFSALFAHRPIGGVSDVQSKMQASTRLDATLEDRRDEMFAAVSMRLFGKAFRLRDFQRFVGEWQIHEPRLLPNPFDPDCRSVARGRKLFETPQVGCVSCHVPPAFTRKDFDDNAEQALPPLVALSMRDAAFTLIGMNRMDLLNGVERDLEPWDPGRAEERQGQFTTLPLRGIWDRPPVFLHSGSARTLREVVATPGHEALGTLKYEPLLGGFPERPGRREVGFNSTGFYTKPSLPLTMQLKAGTRLGIDTHGGTSQLRGWEIDDLVNFMQAIP